MSIIKFVSHFLKKIPFYFSSLTMHNAGIVSRFSKISNYYVFSKNWPSLMKEVFFWKKC